MRNGKIKLNAVDHLSGTINLRTLIKTEWILECVLQVYAGFQPDVPLYECSSVCPISCTIMLIINPFHMNCVSLVKY